MTIKLENAGKKFVKEWIFRNLHLHLSNEAKHIFVGPNGSGKSTLLQAIAGVFPLNEGKITYQHQGQTIEPETAFKHLSLAAPYLELIEDFTPIELFQFHQSFKKIAFSAEEFLEKTSLKEHRHKNIRTFSSGMKQRMKLGLAFFSESSLLILDEPTTNLDKQGIDWYLQLIEQHTSNKLVLIGSNQSHEYSFSEQMYDMRDLK